MFVVRIYFWDSLWRGIIMQKNGPKMLIGRSRPGARLKQLDIWNVQRSNGLGWTEEYVRRYVRIYMIKKKRPMQKEYCNSISAAHMLRMQL